jgi:hypothetical protein
MREETVDDEPHTHRIYPDLLQKNILQPRLRWQFIIPVVMERETSRFEGMEALK